MKILLVLILIELIFPIDLLRKWSEDLYLSEIFWEAVSDSENKNGELKFTLYQMMMNQKEQAEQSLEQDSKEEFKGNPSEKIKYSLEFRVISKPDHIGKEK